MSSGGRQRQGSWMPAVRLDPAASGHPSLPSVNPAIDSSSTFITPTSNTIASNTIVMMNQELPPRLPPPGSVLPLYPPYRSPSQTSTLSQRPTTAQSKNAFPFVASSNPSTQSSRSITSLNPDTFNTTPIGALPLPFTNSARLPTSSQTHSDTTTNRSPFFDWAAIITLVPQHHSSPAPPPLSSKVSSPNDSTPPQPALDTMTLVPQVTQSYPSPITSHDVEKPWLDQVPWLCLPEYATQPALTLRQYTQRIQTKLTTSNPKTTSNPNKNPNPHSATEWFQFTLTKSDGSRRTAFCRRHYEWSSLAARPILLPIVFLMVRPFILISSDASWGVMESVLEWMHSAFTLNSGGLKEEWLSALQLHSFPRLGEWIQVNFERKSSSKSSSKSSLSSFEEFQSAQQPAAAVPPLLRLQRGGEEEVAPFSTLLTLLGLDPLHLQDASGSFVTPPTTAGLLLPPFTLLMALLTALLLERRIVLVSHHLTRISSCMHALLSLLSPLQWQHPHLTIIPHRLTDLLCSPTPFLFGLLPEHLALLVTPSETNQPPPKLLPIEQVVVVDVDKACLLRYDGLQQDLRGVPWILWRALQSELVQASQVSQWTSHAASLTIQAPFLLNNPSQKPSRNGSRTNSSASLPPPFSSQPTNASLTLHSLNNSPAPTSSSLERKRNTALSQAFLKWFVLWLGPYRQGMRLHLNPPVHFSLELFLSHHPLLSTTTSSGWIKVNGMTLEDVSPSQRGLVKSFLQSVLQGQQVQYFVQEREEVLSYHYTIQQTANNDQTDRDEKNNQAKRVPEKETTEKEKVDDNNNDNNDNEKKMRRKYVELAQSLFEQRVTQLEMLLQRGFHDSTS